MSKRSAGRDIALIPEEFQEIATLCAATDVLIGGRTVIGVADARQLHAGLGVGRDFTTWVEGRISKYGFREGIDFERVAAKEYCSPELGSNKVARGGHNAVTYRLTLDMAKELAMVENNEMGRLIRRYYIWLEEARTVPAPSFDASTLGGIVKAVVGKQIKDALTELAPQIIAAQLAADPRVAAVDAVPALQIAIEAKVPKAGRRPIVRAISNSLARHCEAKGHVIRRDVRGTKLYPLAAAHEWRLSGGDHLIRKLVADSKPIGGLFAIDGGKH
ncbi:hypothetical protein E6C67_08175 [Azospirillum sp. TSA2s]|uniref:antA/AntB antirepressor family protein n=1 Tax=Azospirillum sp. TSA2s TaxID=709810 RepID=UPI0010AA3C8B|nr:antA/AntB antirepressor family protein [Azospirillum sp. TSA2s]QCG93917.1 hypothetical protein E6C67_08175 [Azospirillum sp. TSA2s]